MLRILVPRGAPVRQIVQIRGGADREPVKLLLIRNPVPLIELRVIRVRRVGHGDQPPLPSAGTSAAKGL